MLIVSYKISLKGLIYYFYVYHLTTLKHLEDLNIMFLNYLILLLNMGYTMLDLTLCSGVFKHKARLPNIMRHQ